MKNQSLVNAWTRLDRVLQNTADNEEENHRPKTAPYTLNKLTTPSLPSFRGQPQSQPLLPKEIRGSKPQKTKNLVINTSSSINGPSQLISPKDPQLIKPLYPQTARPMSSYNNLNTKDASIISRPWSPNSRPWSPSAGNTSKRLLTSPSSMIMNKTRPISASTAKAFQFFIPKVNVFDPKSYIHHISVADLTAIHEARAIDNKNDQSVNQLKHFLEKYEKHSRHRNLAFDDQCFGPQSGKIIAQILTTDRHFTKINLGKNFISDIGAVAFAQVIRENMNIVHLNLSSNSITHIGAAEIFAALAENESLISLDISSHEGLNRNRIDARGAYPLSWVLQKNKTLQFLNLSATSLDAEAVDYVCKGMQNNTSISVLNLSGNEIGPHLATSLQSCLPVCQLLELSIAQTKLGDQGIVDLAGIFWTTSVKATELRKLDISGNGITAVGTAKLFEALCKNSVLEVLILDKNQLHGKGISSLVGLLWENSTLKHLSMNECDLSLLACDALSNGLDRNRSLEVLHLAKNNFKDAGAKALAAAFKAETSRIKDIDLSDCRIRDAGAKELAEAMMTNHLIEFVNLKDNMIYDDGIIQLINAARINKNLKRVEFDRNPVSYKYLEELYRTTGSNVSAVKNSRTTKFEREIHNLREFELQKFVVADEKETLIQKTKEAQQELEETNAMFKREVQEQQRKYEELEQRLEELTKKAKELDRERNELDKEMMLYASNAKDEIFDIGEIISETAQESNHLEQEIKKIREGFKFFKMNLTNKKDKLQEEVQWETRNAKMAENSITHMNREIAAMQKALEERELQKLEETKKAEMERGRERSGTVGRRKLVSQSSLGDVSPTRQRSISNAPTNSRKSDSRNKLGSQDSMGDNSPRQNPTPTTDNATAAKSNAKTTNSTKPKPKGRKSNVKVGK